MNASETSLWIQFLAGFVAVIVVLCLLPWLGDRAIAGFAVIAIGAVAAWVEGRPGVVIDERDRTIQKKAKHGGLLLGASILFLGLILLAGDYVGPEQIPKSLLAWLLWIAGTTFVTAKGIIGVILYRKDRRAAQS